MNTPATQYPHTQNHYDVIVIGAGPVGMAFALGAAQIGLSVALVGHPSFGAGEEVWDRRVYAFNRASRQFLEALQVWPQLAQERITPVRDMQIFPDPNFAGALCFSAYEACCEALAWIVEHREIARVLHTAIQFQRGITWFKNAITHCQYEDQRVLALMEEPAQALSAALMIGADGAESQVRSSAGIDIETRDYQQIGVVANFACEQAHAGVALQWFSNQSSLALLPLPGNARSLVWSAPRHYAQELLNSRPEQLAERVATITLHASGRLSPLGVSQGFALTRLLAKKKIAQRMALIGDAAHVVHPLAGQGLNLGIEDGAVLLEILEQREMFRDCGDAVLLRRYERRRAEPVLAMSTMTDGLQRLFASHQRWVKSLRNYGMVSLEYLPLVKKILVRHAMG